MSVEKIKAAAAASKDTYFKVRAGDLLAAFQELGHDVTVKGTLAEHAASVCKDGKDREDTVIQLHRDKHLVVLALLTASAP